MSASTRRESANIPACDLCYERKVKCDREETCENCKLAQVECRRTRPQRSLSVAERLSKLENKATQPIPE
ncbi:hypothetical protein BO71DRAFT_432759 [Aspergillus ellipticus CBS 707.79]|uniref:Zn(2)-C6 fungal-type domain-containing protein n=1 Tax=Aspergillus ellipticus CBS 707.79 TaxID=1448320 RepID=A0A319D263_9EURO|nr:hypothetical protein BO71DRAFT_432759 [Aspergillus ellipticus CBS 707.79]